jgi:chromosome segregation protein
VHALQMDVLKLAQAHERYTQRSTQIREELEEIGAQIDEQRALRAESEANFERFDGELAELQARFEDNQLAFEALDESLTQARRKRATSSAGERRALRGAQRGHAHRRAQAQHPGRARAERARRRVAGRRPCGTRNDQRADRAHRPAGRARDSRGEGARCRPRGSNSTT